MIVVLYEETPDSHVDDLFVAYHVTEISIMYITSSLTHTLFINFISKTYLALNAVSSLSLC